VATSAKIQQERKGFLRAAKRAERKVDTSLELLEREMARLLLRKRLLDTDDANRVALLYRKFYDTLGQLAQALTDFTNAVSW
jgi:hypothetical protein